MGGNENEISKSSKIHNEVDFWDTAYIYGPKKSEEIIGEVLTETKARDQIVLSIKAAHVEKNGEMTFDNSPQFLVQAVEESLKRLQTDYIDLFYIHFLWEFNRCYFIVLWHGYRSFYKSKV